MRVYEIEKGSQSFDGLRRGERPDPEPGPNEVLVRMRAASLNYRDLAVATGKYFGGPVQRDMIPLSDGAGTVERVGEAVTGFEPGDRVVALFSQPPSGAPLGSPLDGCLSELRVFDAAGLLPIPGDLSYEEASTLPCAGVTAWNALTHGRTLRPGDTVLTLGTGGVSIFALQLAKAAGARVIVTSSSDAKLERARALGADETINYKTTPEWGAAVVELTGGRGADQIVEVGGFGTLPQSYQAVGPGGEIAMIGVLTAAQGDLSPHPLMVKNASLRGIFVGAAPQFDGLEKAIAANGIKPVVDRVFELDETPEAYRCLAAAQHFGKLVIAV